MRPLIARSLTLPLILLVLGGCADSRIERYYAVEDAPKATEGDGVTVRLLYYKQSMRHFYATLRVTNDSIGTVTFIRAGDGTGDVLLDVAGTTYIAEEPTHNTWTPWTGIVERSPDQIGRLSLAPGASTEISLRWAFPSTQASYAFDWTMRFHGLKRGDALVPDVVLKSPGR